MTGPFVTFTDKYLQKMILLQFNDGTHVECSVVAKALNVLVVRTQNGFQLVNRNALIPGTPYASLDKE